MSLSSNPELAHTCVSEAEINSIVDKFKGQRGDLIAILSEVQNRYSYLPELALRIVAEKTGRQLIDVYGVATFYHSFSLKPRGKHLCSVCQGTACHVRGAAGVAAEFERQLNVKPGETTEDNEFTLEYVNCLGACALGPIVVVDGQYFSGVTKTRVNDVIRKIKAGKDTDIIPQDSFPIEVNCARCNHSLMDPTVLIDGRPSIKLTVAFQNRHGWVRLSSLYGSYNVKCEYDIPPSAVVNFFCPHCHTSLVGAAFCVDCGAPLIPMVVQGGGLIQVCSRRGCKSHRLDIAVKL